MKLFFLKIITVLLVLNPLVSEGFAKDKTPDGEVSQSQRDQEATQKLKGKTDIVSVYVKGLCCPSCASGIRRKITKLDFIDLKRLAKGVELDTKNQLATIAIKKGQTIDGKSLAKAIDAAGYDAVYLYQMKNGKLSRESISTK